MVVAVDGKLAATIQVADALRPDAKDAVVKLQQMGIRPILLSGASRSQGQADPAGHNYDQHVAARLKQHLGMAVD